MPIKVENQHSLQRAFREGINLFLGAGFSVHAEDQSGNKLPTGAVLAQELSRKFGVPNTLPLPHQSTILESTRREEYRQFLRKRFTVGEYDERYSALEKANIKTVFTTNIDNLISRIYEHSHKFYVNDITLHGPVATDRRAIDYVPLHGSVENESRPFVFSSSDLASTYNDDRDTWQFLRQSVYQRPILFWGYSLADAGVLQALFSGRTDNMQEQRWIVLRDPTEDVVAYFKALNFSIIEAQTLEMLEYIGNVSSDTIDDSTSHITTDRFALEKIPSIHEVSKRPIRDFYLGAPPIWWDVFSESVHRTSHYNRLMDKVDSGQNVIVVGGPAAGKTTLLMQVARGLNYPDKHILVILDSLTKERASFLVRELGDEKAVVFVDDFTDDIEAFEVLLKAPNIQVVAFDREYNYQIVSYRLDANDVVHYNVTELDQYDFQGIFSQIPLEIRGESLVHTAEDTSLFEFIEKNITKPTISERMQTVIQQLNTPTNRPLLEFFVMCCYVHSCRTPVSFDMAMAFLRQDINDYTDVFRVVQTLGSLIQDYAGELVDDSQDYYKARSMIVSETIMKRVPTPVLKNVLYRFYDNVSPFRICRYDVFKRSAYDFKIMRRAFVRWEDGMEFYKKLYETDNTPYLLQQGALFLSDKKRYTEAFKWIEKAISTSENKIFSIRNSHAIILFEANIQGRHEDPTIRDTLNSSMEILRACYTHDKRKTYHAIKFSEQAIQYYRKYGDDISVEYLKTASEWLKEETEKFPWNYAVKRLIRNVKDVLISAEIRL